MPKSGHNFSTCVHFVKVLLGTQDSLWMAPQGYLLLMRLSIIQRSRQGLLISTYIIEWWGKNEQAMFQEGFHNISICEQGLFLLALRPADQFAIPLLARGVISSCGSWRIGQQKVLRQIKIRRRVVAHGPSFARLSNRMRVLIACLAFPSSLAPHKRSRHAPSPMVYRGTLYGPRTPRGIST